MIRSILVSVATLLALCLPSANSLAAARSAPRSTALSQARAVQLKAHLASLPLGFEPNQGQTAHSVRFLAHGAGYTAFLTARDITLAIASRGRAGNGAALRFTPLGARAASPIAANRLSGTVSYFLGSTAGAWVTGVHRFGRITYRDLYPGIDLAVYGRQSRLEYDWVVRPGASPSSIRLALEGASKVSIDSSGALLLTTSAGPVRQSRPNVYQIVGGRRHPVSVRVLLRHDVLRFAVGSYDRNLPLVIDPALTYSTYLGGGSNDAANGIAVDANGDAYVTGYTASTNFPVASNGYRLTNQGTTDAFLTVIDPAGTSLLYSGYLGGAGSDFGQSVALDGTGDGYAYLTGYTYSSNFPTTPSALQFSAPAGEYYHAFVTVLNTTSTTIHQLAYSTYLGGTTPLMPPSTGTIGYGIAADSGHNAYVTGLTYATTLPTLHPFQSAQSTAGSHANAFLIRLATTQYQASSLVYGTYFGASLNVDVGAYGITTDGHGTAAITGFVKGTGLPTRNALQSGYGGGTDDAFVAGFDTNATGGNNSLLFSSYLGGVNDDLGRAIATDGAGNYYLTGSTASGNFPQTDPANPVVPPTSRGGASDVFVTKLHFPGNAALTIGYSILIGGTLQDVGTGIGFDYFGNAYITGYTASTNFPIVTPLPAQGTYNGGAHDAFVTEVNAGGTGLVYSTYLGGSGDDLGLGIAIRATDAFVAGSTTSPNFPAGSVLSPGANKGTICPGQATPCSDGFVARLGQSVANPLAGTVKGSAICTLHNHTTLGPTCSVSPAVNCGTFPTCQIQMQVNAACTTPPAGYSCGSTGGKFGVQGFYAQWLSGSISGTSFEGGSTTLQGIGFYGPTHGPNANAKFVFSGQDLDTGIPASDVDTFQLTISPINGAVFPVTTGQWTCGPPSPPCSLEIVIQ